MPFLFFSEWHSFIIAKRSIFFEKSDITIAEKVSHSENRALFTIYKEGLFYKCYNEDMMVFVMKVKNYMVSSEFVKSMMEKVYSIGFPSSEL